MCPMCRMCQCNDCVNSSRTLVREMQKCIPSELITQERYHMQPEVSSHKSSCLLSKPERKLTVFPRILAHLNWAKVTAVAGRTVASWVLVMLDVCDQMGWSYLTKYTCGIKSRVCQKVCRLEANIIYFFRCSSGSTIWWYLSIWTWAQIFFALWWYAQIELLKLFLPPGTKYKWSRKKPLF